MLLGDDDFFVYMYILYSQLYCLRRIYLILLYYTKRENKKKKTKKKKGGGGEREEWKAERKEYNKLIK